MIANRRLPYGLHCSPGPERNDNAKPIKMDGAIRSVANREFEVLCSSHSIA
jgi:hypothetical protein